MARVDKTLSDQIVELLAREHLLTAPELVSLLEQAGNKYNKTSVYRTLDKLVEQGSVCKQHFGDNTIKYELRSGHHDHLVCTSCGSVVACPCSTTTETSIQGFAVDHHHITYYGTCVNCQKLESNVEI